MGNKSNAFKADEDTDEDADLARFVNKICIITIVCPIGTGNGVHDYFSIRRNYG